MNLTSQGQDLISSSICALVCLVIAGLGFGAGAVFFFKTEDKVGVGAEIPDWDLCVDGGT